MNSLKHDAFLFKSATIKLFVFLFFSLLIICSFIAVPYSDAFYYWDWSRHLALSYYDGAPMIAYLMRLYSLFFANSVYALNFLGVTSICVILFFMYKTGELLFDKKIALNACFLWLISPLVIHFLFFWVTYDNPLNVFWAATIYFVVRFIQFKQTRDLYFIGSCIGLMLLSKYTGVILVLALILFILSVPRYWFLFRNKHFYLSLMLAAVIASPIFIWNYQHHWASFLYQLQAHQNSDAVSLQSVFKFLVKIILRLNILLFLFIYGLFKSFKTIKQNDGLFLLNMISGVFLLFFSYQSLKQNVSQHWLLPFCFTSALLSSYYLVKYQMRKLFIATVVLYLGCSIYYLISDSIFQKYFDGSFASYPLVKQAGDKYLEQNSIVMTSNWESAAKIMFWLPGKPNVYTLPCGGENQYAFWSQSIVKQIKDKSIQKVLYLDFEDHSICMKQSFRHCELLQTLSADDKFLEAENEKKKYLFVYQCVV